MKVELRVLDFLPFLSSLSVSKQQAQYQKAEEDATRAIQWDPTYSKAYYRRSLARTALGNLEQAVEDLTKVKELWPEDPQIDREIRDLRNMQSAKQRELVDAEKQESFILNSKKEPQSSSSLGSIGSADNQGTQSKQGNAHECNCSTMMEQGRNFEL